MKLAFSSEANILRRTNTNLRSASVRDNLIFSITLFINVILLLISRQFFIFSFFFEPPSL